MKSFKKILLAAALFVLPLAVFATVASAQRVETGNTVNVKDKVVNNTVFAAGNTVDIGGIINGDVFCGGQTVTVSGTVNGDVICAGQSVTITGKVNGSVRLGGQTVVIAGEVSDSATVAAQSFTLQSDGMVGRDTMGAVGTATINGRVGRDLGLNASTVAVSSEIDRNINGNINELSLNDGASVNDVLVTSANEPQVAEGAQVRGAVERKQPQTKDQASVAAVPFALAFSLLWIVYLLFALLLVSIVLVLVMPQIIHSSADRTIAEPWKTLLVGFLAAIAVPVGIIALLFTVVGIPLALIILVAWILISALSGAFFAYFIGRLLFRQVTNPILIMLAGSGVVLVAYFLPLLGLLVMIAAHWFGVGMILMELHKRVPRPSYELK